MVVVVISTLACHAPRFKNPRPNRYVISQSGDAEEQVAQAPARPRGRAATEPAIFAHGELDNVESDSDEGAVGGREDPADDEDKLVKEIAQLLIKKGDILVSAARHDCLSRLVADDCP